MKRDPGDGLKDPEEMGIIERRTGGPHGGDVVSGFGFRSQGAGDLPVEIKPVGLYGLAHRAGPGQAAAGPQRDVADGDDLHGRHGIESHDADIQDGLAVPVDGPLRRLFGRRRFLKEPSDPAFARRAINAVAAGQFGRGGAAKAGDAAICEAGIGAVEAQQDVAAGDDDLPAAGA